MVKTCTICKIEKELSNFILDKRKEGRRRPQCRDCSNAFQRKWRSGADGRLFTKRWAKTAAFKSIQKRFKKTVRGQELAKSNALKRVESGQMPAHGAVYRALKNGVIFRKNICAACFRESEITHFHHLKGYNKTNWLDVVELCVECHSEAHAEPDHQFHPRIENDLSV